MVGREGTTVAVEASRVFAAATGQVVEARRFVRRTVARHVPADVAADLELIVSELFTNAVQHGRSSTVSVTVEVGSGQAGVTVDCASPAPDVGPVETWEVADEAALRGRGLGIVRRLADVIRVERDDDRFTVVVRRMFAPTARSTRS